MGRISCFCSLVVVFVYWEIQVYYIEALLGPSNWLVWKQLLRNSAQHILMSCEQSAALHHDTNTASRFSDSAAS